MGAGGQTRPERLRSACELHQFSDVKLAPRLPLSLGNIPCDRSSRWKTLFPAASRSASTTGLAVLLLVVIAAAIGAADGRSSCLAPGHGPGRDAPRAARKAEGDLPANRRDYRQPGEESGKSVG